MIGVVAVVRALHLGALALMLGAFAFLPLVARPAFDRARSLAGEAAAGGGDLLELDRALRRLAGASLIVAALTAVAWLAVQAVLLTGSLDAGAVLRVLRRTQFGRLWQLRLGLLALLAIFLAWSGREVDRRDWMAVRLELLGLGALVVGALAWAGHAAATEPTRRAGHLAADVIHLLATAVWLGGLLPLALLLSRIRRARLGSARAVAAEAVRRFSALALACVIALTLTGLVNTWILSGDVPSLLGTAYGRWLILKLAIFAAVIAIAAVNLLRLKPRLAAAAGRDGASALLAALRRNAGWEMVGGALVLLVVGILGITPPGRHADPDWPLSFRWSWQVAEPAIRLVLAAALAGAVLGAATLGSGLLLRRGRPWTIALGLALVMASTVAAATAVPTLSVDAYPTTYLRSPIAYSAASIARGEALFAGNCAVCHGTFGEGDGPAAAALARRPADLTGAHTAAHTSGDMYWWLTNGIKDSPMPAFREQLSPRDRWDLINFLHALAYGEQARRLSPAVEPESAVVAPDIGFGIGFGPIETLREERGRAIVLLVFFTLPDSLPRLEQLDRDWSALGYAGARVIAVPMADADAVYRRLGPRVANFSIAVDGADAATRAYAHFRFTPAPKRTAPPVEHMEFLIDRRGYIRARWLPGREPGWSDTRRLVAEIERLDREPAGSPAPEEHVH
ncbi:MAG TPA: CopD family protein [Candidatus Methylomirabilis sp.]|nr:CopD family protein [Candidatus Methylomirabilis sp.]